MSYTVRYSGTRNAKFLKATQDALDYNARGVYLLCGEFPIMWETATTLEEKKQAIRHFHLCAAFAGIQGFPVRALMRRALGKVPFTINID